MFTRCIATIIAIFLFGVVLTNAESHWKMVRLNQSGDIIDGPVDLEDVYCDGTCKISDLGYIYFTSYYSRIYCYDSSLNLADMVDRTEGDSSLSIDNVRQEIVADNTISRYSSPLNFTDDHDVYAGLKDITVDENDGSIWYSAYTLQEEEQGLYKVDHDFNQIIAFPGESAHRFSDVSPDGTFWNSAGDSVQLRTSDGTIKAQCNVGGTRSMEMYFADESCWCCGISSVVKVNSSGTIVYSDNNYVSTWDVDVDQSDGSVWIADRGGYELIHLDANGNELLRKSNEWAPVAVAVDPSDSSVILIYQPEGVNIESASLGTIKASFAEIEE